MGFGYFHAIDATDENGSRPLDPYYASGFFKKYSSSIKK